MTEINLDEESSIKFLQDVEILPIKAEINVKEQEKNIKVTRIYKINSNNTGFPNLTILTIEYNYTKFQEKIVNYIVYASNDNKILIFANSANNRNVCDKMFNDIIKLELKKWRPLSKKG